MTRARPLTEGGFAPRAAFAAESKSDSPSSLVIATLSIVGATVSIKPGNCSAASGLFSSPYAAAVDPPLLVVAKSNRAVLETAGGLVVSIAAHSQMDVTDERQSQSF